MLYLVYAKHGIVHDNQKSQLWFISSNDIVLELLWFVLDAILQTCKHAAMLFFWREKKEAFS